VILREFDASRGDAARLNGFACSTGAPFEAEVEEWIRTTAVLWLNDVPRARFQRRSVGFVEDGDELVAVVAWQDIARIDLDGISLEVLAVSVDRQHSGHGTRAYDRTIDHLRTIERDGDHLAGLVHVDNGRSQRLLRAKAWTAVTTWGDHEVWVGRL
jgi:hypothetical protein